MSFREESTPKAATSYTGFRGSHQKMISQHWCISHSQDIWCLYNIIVTNHIVVFSVGPVYVLIPRLYAWLSDLLGHWYMGRSDSMPVQSLNYLDLIIVGEKNPAAQLAHMCKESDRHTG